MSYEYFDKALENEDELWKKDMARCYASICKMYGSQGGSREPTTEQYSEILLEIEKGVEATDMDHDEESNFDKVVFYESSVNWLVDQRENLVKNDVPLSDVIDLMSVIKQRCKAIETSLPRVKETCENLLTNYPATIDLIEASYEKE